MSEQEESIRRKAVELVDALLQAHWESVVNEREAHVKKRASIALTVTTCTFGVHPTVKAKISGGSKWRDEADAAVKDPNQLELPGGEK